MIIAEHLADLPLPNDKNELVDDTLPDENIFHVDREDIANHEWYKDITTYLKSQDYPSDSSSKKKRRIRATSREYLILSNILYKRSFDRILLRCLTPTVAQKVLYESHGSIYGGHFGGQSTALQILWMGYYWPTLFKDTHNFVHKCHRCQEHSHLFHAPAQSLRSIATPWPFSKWGLDLIGVIHPTSSNQHKFILTAMTYFTKWVEAIPLIITDGHTISMFIFEHIICRFGILDVIITDNGTSLCNKHIDELCQKFQITHRTFAPYCPQANG